MSDLEASIYSECHAVGGMTAHYRLHDPQRLAFVAARYLFVAKMLAGRESVLEVGCADGYFSPIVRQHVGALTAIDSDAASIGQARAMNSAVWPIDFQCLDFMAHDQVYLTQSHAAAYALDVLEHIHPEHEPEFLQRLSYCSGPCVLGLPSRASQVHASELSRKGHVNCKSARELAASLSQHWQRVAPFSMNDTAFYPGFSEMARYYLAVCSN